MQTPSRFIARASSPDASWRPLVEPEIAARFVPVLESIAGALAQTGLTAFFGNSLSTGAAGIALFFAYLNRVSPDDRWSRLAQFYLTRTLDVASEGRAPTWLFSGALGVAWTVEHLRGAIAAPSSQKSRGDLDEELLSALRGPWTDRYDLMRGLVGCGVYALQYPDSPVCRKILTRIVAHLEASAMSDSHGTTWLTPAEHLPESQRVLYPDGCFDLGVAHGVPGVIALLGQICAAGVATATASPLLESAVNWLLTRQNPDHDLCCYPMQISKEGIADSLPSRLAWCYGDLGVSVSLYSAGVNARNPGWCERAVGIATHAASRPPARGRVRDAGLCHGAAGNAHLFNRLFQATGERVFMDAARYWLIHSLDFHEPGKGIGGFQMWRGEGFGSTWAATPGLLEGTAGIGLAILASISAVEPAWDRAMLAALTPRLHAMA